LAVLERRKSEVSILRDLDEVGEHVICERLGHDIVNTAELAKYIEGKGLSHAVTLVPYGVGAIVDALDEVGISGQDRGPRYFSRLEVDPVRSKQANAHLPTGRSVMVAKD
jgi:hypothetical protein